MVESEAGSVASRPPQQGKTDEKKMHWSNVQIQMQFFPTNEMEHQIKKEGLNLITNGDVLETKLKLMGFTREFGFTMKR